MFQVGESVFLCSIMIQSLFHLETFTSHYKLVFHCIQWNSKVSKLNTENVSVALIAEHAQHTREIKKTHQLVSHLTKL